MKNLKFKIKFFLNKNKIKYGKDYYNGLPIDETLIITTVYRHSEKLSKALGLNIEVNPRALKLVLSKFYRFGKPYCPCRLEMSEKTLCPCVYHVEEILEKGHCKCGLFYVKKK